MIRVDLDVMLAKRNPFFNVGSNLRGTRLPARRYFRTSKGVMTLSFHVLEGYDLINKLYVGATSMGKPKNKWFIYTMLSLAFTNLSLVLKQPLLSVAAVLMAVAGIFAARKGKKNDPR